MSDFIALEKSYMCSREGSTIKIKKSIKNYKKYQFSTFFNIKIHYD